MTSAVPPQEALRLGSCPWQAALGRSSGEAGPCLGPQERPGEGGPQAGGRRMPPLSRRALVTPEGSHGASLIIVQAAQFGAWSSGRHPSGPGGPSAGRRTGGEGPAGLAVTVMKPSHRCNEDLMYRQGHLANRAQLRNPSPIELTLSRAAQLSKLSHSPTRLQGPAPVAEALRV